jgi:hypothetical protein
MECNVRPFCCHLLQEGSIGHVGFDESRTQARIVIVTVLDCISPRVVDSNVPLHHLFDDRRFAELPREYVIADDDACLRDTAFLVKAGDLGVRLRGRPLSG